MLPPFPPRPMNNTLARKPSDSSSSDSTVVPDEICSSCIINFLHLRPQHSLDAVVDDITKRGEDDADMMDADDVVMTIDASMSLSQEDITINNNNVKKPPPSSAHQKVETTRPARYQSPLPEDINARKPSPTTPPPRPRGRSNDSLDIITNDYYPPLSAESISAELHHYSSALSIPTLSSRFPPESLPQQQQQQSHLISTANDDEDDAPLLSLNAMSMNHANPNEAMLPPIPRINLQMRHSQQTTSFPCLPARVAAETDGRRGSRFAATQPQTAVEAVRQSPVVGFVPIQQVDSNEEEEDEDEEDLLAS